MVIFSTKLQGVDDVPTSAAVGDVSFEILSFKLEIVVVDLVVVSGDGFDSLFAVFVEDIAL